MKDIVKRLRDINEDGSGSARVDVTCDEAAAEIERLRAALESADASFKQLHKWDRLPAGENNAGWRDVRAALNKGGEG